MIAPEVTAWHALVWRPGGVMHNGWWHALGLAAWRDIYRNTPACRAVIDRCINARRQWPSIALPTCFDDNAHALFALRARLPALVIALGLREMACADYLLLGTFRRVLARWLTPEQCERLLLMRTSWPSMPQCQPDTLPDTLFVAGTRALTWAVDDGQSRVSSHVATALLSLLPPLPAGPCRPGEVPSLPSENPWESLQRMGRWL